MAVIGKLQDVGHGLAVAGNGGPCLAGGIERLFPFRGCYRVVETHVVALDAVRALDGPGERDSP